MLLGFISLLLTVGQGSISDICISEEIAATWHPCSKKHEGKKNLGEDNRRRLLTMADDGDGSARRILAAYGADKCAEKVIDESGDCSGKEQMAVVVRYVNCAGFVMERFLGIIHVKETSANSLKEALQNLLGLHRLSLSSIRGQGYDGASNMRGRYGDAC
ncbi:hypothetical protein OROHE_000815 [Orobanche hederae]